MCFRFTTHEANHPEIVGGHSRMTAKMCDESSCAKSFVVSECVMIIAIINFALVANSFWRRRINIEEAEYSFRKTPCHRIGFPVQYEATISAKMQSTPSRAITLE